MTSFFDRTECVCQIKSVYRKRSTLGHASVANRPLWELVYKLDGSSDQIFPTKRLRLLPDCLYVIPSHYQRNEVEVDRPGDIISVVFTVFNSDETIEPEILQLAENNAIKPQFERMLAVWQKADVSYLLDTQAILMSILSGILRQRHKAYASEGGYHYIQPALEWMEKSFASPITIKELAGMCGISDEYMRQLFQTYTGRTPMEYLRSIRLRHAQNLLLSGQSNVMQTAYACGFEDPKYFSRVFAREFGVSPRSMLHKTIG